MEEPLVCGAMELEITPEADPDQREAIEAALERLLADAALPPAYLSAWRQAGIAENVSAD